MLTIKKTGLFLLSAFLLAVPAQAQLQDTWHFGVKPTENITTLEVNPSLTVIDDKEGISSSSVTVKTYRVINENFNWGAELPFSRFETPGHAVNGIGDLSLSATGLYQPSSALGVGFKMETFLPTATKDELGSGKWVLSPTAFAVFTFENQAYILAEYKHYASVAGDGGRSHVNYARPRITLGYTSASQWYALTNLYYYVDFANHMRNEFAPELELGTLVNEGTAFYLNVSTHAGGNWDQKDWGVSIGFKLLYL